MCNYVRFSQIWLHMYVTTEWGLPPWISLQKLT